MKVYKNASMQALQYASMAVCQYRSMLSMQASRYGSFESRQAYNTNAKKFFYKTYSIWYALWECLIKRDF